MREKSRPRDKSRTRSPTRVTSNLPNYYDNDDDPRTPRMARKKSVGGSGANFATGKEDDRFHDCHDHRSGRNKKKNRNAKNDKEFNNNNPHDNNDREVVVTADKNGEMESWVSIRPQYFISTFSDLLRLMITLQSTPVLSTNVLLTYFGTLELQQNKGWIETRRNVLSDLKKY